MNYYQSPQFRRKYAKECKKRERMLNYGKPICNGCPEVYMDKSMKHNGITYYCRLTGRDVGQSVFGLNSPRTCPRRSSEERSG